MSNEAIYKALARVIMHGYMPDFGTVVDVAPNGQTIVERPDPSGGEPLQITLGDPNEPPWQNHDENYRIAVATPGER